MKSNINKFNNSGKEEGYWEEPDGDGKLFASGYFYNGKKTGKWEVFNPNGTHMHYVYYDELTEEAKYRKWYDETYSILKRDYKYLYDNYKAYAILPLDNMSSIETVPYEGSKTSQKECGTYIQHVREIYQNVKNNDQ